jgi:hypothetical protein
MTKAEFNGATNRNDFQTLRKNVVEIDGFFHHIVWICAERSTISILYYLYNYYDLCHNYHVIIMLPLSSGNWLSSQYAYTPKVTM